MKYKQFIINNIDIIKKYDNKILSINKVKYEDKKFYKNNLTKYKNNLRLDLKSKKYDSHFDVFRLAFIYLILLVQNLF